MITVHTVSHSLPWRKCTDNGVVPFLGRSLKKSQQIFYILRSSDTRQHRQHSRLIQCILDALVTCQRSAKRRCFIIQQLPAGKGFHHGNAHPVRLASAVHRHPLFGTAVCIVSTSVIISGIDGEHQLIHNSGIQYLCHKAGRMGRQPDMPYHSLLF